MSAEGRSAVRMVDDRSAAAAWRAFAGTSSRRIAVDVIKRGDKSAVFRLRGAGPGRSGVVAKALLQDGLTVERAVYDGLLPQLPVPALRCYGTTETTDGCCWIFLEDAGGREYAPWSPRDRALAARWLATVHAASARLRPPPSLPRRNARWYRTDVARVREQLAAACNRRSLLPSDRRDLAGIVRHLDALAADWSLLEADVSAIPQALVHGDFCAKNLRVRTVGGARQLAVFDWDAAAWGVCALDLASETLESASPSPRVYWLTLRRSLPGVTPGIVRAAATASAVLRLVAAMEWELAKSHRLRDPWTVANLRDYGALMRDAIAAVRAGRNG